MMIRQEGGLQYARDRPVLWYCDKDVFEVRHMIPRISTLIPLPDYRLVVGFDDGRRVVYDVREDMDLPGYEQLRTVTGLFQAVQLDQSRTCVYWNDMIDLASDSIYLYGKEI